MFYLKQHQPSGAKLIELPDWKLSSYSGKASRDSYLKRTSVTCWSTTLPGASPG